jgi:Leucine-rich repeat (LRR) protein
LFHKVRNFLLFLTLITNGCNPPPDLPPFILTTTVLENSTSVRLDWTLVQDSRLGTVFYDIFLGNTRIAQNITNNTFTINNLQFDTFYTGRLVGRINSGDTEFRDFSFTTGKDYISIPDPGFEQALIDGGFDTEGIRNSKMLRADAPAVRNLKAANYGISNLEGIQHFVNLENFTANKNQISQANFGQNTLLQSANLSENQFSNLNFSPNVRLKFLYVFKNNLNQLNITQNTELEVLVADNNRLAALDLSRATKLKSLGLSNNLLNNINLNNNILIEALDISSNPMTSINLSNLTQLKDFGGKFCNFSNINFNANVNLEFLNISNNLINTINITLNPELKVLDVSNNRLTRVNVKNNSKLIILNTKNNPNLSQICVNNVAAAMAIEEWEKDTFTNYSVNCN